MIVLSKKTVPNNRFPFITCYARLLDRVTLKPITEFSDALDKSKIWDLGLVHSEFGGLSQYIIELDIWNNEPSVSGGMTKLTFDDAENCNITIWDNEFKNSSPIFSSNYNCQIRNSLFELNSFDNIIESIKFDVNGNVDNKKTGTLHGISDHSKIQIGLQLFKNSFVNGEKQNFYIFFEYESNKIPVSLIFKCSINLTNSMLTATKDIVSKYSNTMSGKINGSRVQKTIIEAYDINKKLKDRCVSFDNNYCMFLTKGIYNINIENYQYKRSFNYINISEGINENYSNVKNGIILDMYNDVTEYLDLDKSIYEVHGFITNEYNEFVKNAEIIITQNNNIISYCLTDTNGQYRFLLENGVYDIRIRSIDKPVKIYNNFEFINTEGFLKKLSQISYNFKNEFNFYCNY